MDKFAAAHISDCGPTLRMKAEYGIPAGSGDDPKLDEDGNVIEEVRRCMERLLTGCP